MHYIVDIGYKLEKIRKLKGYSQEYIAGKLDISQNSYGRIERGETRVTQKKLNAICDALEIDVTFLQNFNPLEKCFQTNEAKNSIVKAYSSLERIENLYGDLIAEKDARIRHLEEVVQILKQNREFLLSDKALNTEFARKV